MSSLNWGNFLDFGYFFKNAKPAFVPPPDIAIAIFKCAMPGNNIFIPPKSP